MPAMASSSSLGQLHTTVRWQRGPSIFRLSPKRFNTCDPTSRPPAGRNPRGIPRRPNPKGETSEAKSDETPMRSMGNRASQLSHVNLGKFVAVADRFRMRLKSLSG